MPPPSNFNRRVTPELDAISLKALSRDVADRYQSASHLAADLDALIAGYRFDPKELRQFMRQLFRKEYAKELEDTQLSLESEPGLSMSTSGSMIASLSTGPVARVEMTPPSPSASAPMSSSGSRRGKTPEPQPEPPSVTIETDPVDPADVGSDKPRGFWGSLFKKRK